MRNKPPTPETDKFKIKLKTLCGEKYWVPVEHSERLELERDEAREDLKNIKKLHCDQSTEMLKLVFENRNLEQKADILKEMLDMQTKLVVDLEMRLMKKELDSPT